MDLRPHDIISFTQIEDLLSKQNVPEWLKEVCKEGFYGVVRRDCRSDQNLIPIGIRGLERGQRFAAWITTKKIGNTIFPSTLTNPLAWRVTLNNLPSKVISTLINICPILNNSGYKWGPTGSAGFEVATGIKAIKETSDLDLLIYAPQKIDLLDAQHLLSKLKKVASCNLDIQLETPKGGVSLIEFTQSDQVLVKSNQGPFLISIENIWDQSK